MGSPARSPGDATGASASLRVAVVGPTHPYKGGIAAHTTTLAHELAAAGHDVTLVSWSHLYPSKLYPGEQAVPDGAPDVEPFPRSIPALSWARPDTWVRTGRRLRDMDAIIVVHVIPAVVPAHLSLLRAAGVGRIRSTPLGPRSVVIAHNVLPHEPHPGDRQLVSALFRRVDAVLVHSSPQAQLARELGAERVSIADLPPHLPGGSPVERRPYAGPPRLLAMGIVRDYKGVDVLLRALMEVPELRLTVAGEMWGEAGREVRALASDPRLAGRVAVHPGYVPADRLAPMLAAHDVLTLTYRSATASQYAFLAQQHGLPVLASNVGTFGEQVRHDVDGLLVPPGDERSLVEALHHLAEPGVVERLRAEVKPPDLSGPWAGYIGAIEALAGDSSAEDRSSDREGDAGAEAGAEARGRPVGARAVAREALRAAAGSASTAWRARRPTVTVTPADFPEWVQASDILADAESAEDARDLARGLGLPRTADSIAAWAALGALAAIVRVRDDGRRTAVIIDESGTRSPLSRWARTIGFAPVELELTGLSSSVDVLDVDTASLDVITRLHPRGCDADDIDEALGQASWALRSGGLLSVTLPVGPQTVPTAVSAADVRAILARAGDLGFVLVGDLEGDVTERMRQASAAATQADAAYGLIRLTFRRR